MQTSIFVSICFKIKQFLSDIFYWAQTYVHGVDFPRNHMQHLTIEFYRYVTKRLRFCEWSSRNLL